MAQIGGERDEGRKAESAGFNSVVIMARHL